MYHKNIEQNPCALYLVSFPTTQVAVVNKATEDQFELLQGDMNLLNFIENIQSLKIRQQFIVMGNEYEVGDFRIRLGLASISNETKFLILEIEFIAINIKSCGQPCINEFKGYLDPESKLKETSIEYYKYFKLNSEEFTAKHSAIDMLLSLNCLDIK